MASRAPTRSGLLEGDEVLAFLAQTSASVGATLDYERALASAASAAVPRFADWCGVDIVEPTGRVRQIVSAELSPEHARLLASLRDADCAGVPVPGPRVHIVAPLIARERTLGAVTFLLTGSGREYGERDVAVAGELARRLALAVDNARLYEMAERTSDRLTFLAEASASVGATLDYERVLREAARAAVPRFADWCGVDIVQPDGSVRTLSTDLDPAQQALMDELRRRYRAERGASEGVLRVIATGEAELFRDVSAGALIPLRDDEVEDYARLSPQSYVIAPLVARDRTLGALTFMSTTPGRHYDETDLELASELARRLALAVDNARLFAEAEHGRERVGFLVEASELLSETLDVDGLLGRLAALTVPRLADWSRTYLLEDGELRLVSVTHADPAKVAAAEELQRRYPVRAGARDGGGHVAITGRSQLFAEVTDDILAGVAHDDEHLRMMRELGLRSSLSVPLVGRSGPIGALTLMTAESGRRLGAEDLRLAEELGRRAGIAIENARLHAAASEAAERSQEWLALLIDNVQDYAIFSFDPEGRVASWNRGAERLTGYTADEIVGEHFSRFYVPEDVAQGHPARELQIAVAEGRYEEEGWRVRKDGSRYWASVLITALRTSDGELRGFAKVTRDMTDRKVVEEELRRSNEELERYAYLASHDLSEPLRVIAGFSSLLRRRFGGRLGEDGDSFIEAIVDGTERMQALIDDLLTFSRLDRAARDLAPVATAEVVAEAIRVLGETDGEVVVDGELPVVLGQRSLLGQLFQNLIANGLKFTAGQRARVAVWAEPAEQGWCFAVRDNGIGIDPEDRERIFEIFERLHGRDEFSGTGIGLAICRKVVELHGGRIWVQDVPDGGSEFRFTLPAAEK